MVKTCQNLSQSITTLTMHFNFKEIIFPTVILNHVLKFHLLWIKGTNAYPYNANVVCLTAGLIFFPPTESRAKQLILEEPNNHWSVDTSKLITMLHRVCKICIYQLKQHIKSNNLLFKPCVIFVQLFIDISLDIQGKPW